MTSDKQTEANRRNALKKHRAEDARGEGRRAPQRSKARPPL
jgi:hypothetical protein